MVANLHIHIKTIERVCTKCNGFMELISPPHRSEVVFACKNNGQKEDHSDSLHDVFVSYHRVFRCFSCQNGKLELIGHGFNPDKLEGDKDYCYKCDLCQDFKFYDEPLEEYN